MNFPRIVKYVFDKHVGSFNVWALLRMNNNKWLIWIEKGLNIDQFNTLFHSSTTRGQFNTTKCPFEVCQCPSYFMKLIPAAVLALVTITLGQSVTRPHHISINTQRIKGHAQVHFWVLFGSSREFKDETLGVELNTSPSTTTPRTPQDTLNKLKWTKLCIVCIPVRLHIFNCPTSTE